MSPPESLWDFAVRVYALDHVASLCLRLQDRHGLDVDVLLACLWLAQRGHAVEPTLLDAVLEAAEPRQAHVERIRSLRRSMGEARDREPAWLAPYEHLKAAELAAERVELEAIEHALSVGPSPGPPRPDDALPLAREGLRRYVRRLDARSCDALLDELARRALDPGADRG